MNKKKRRIKEKKKGGKKRKKDRKKESSSVCFVKHMMISTQVRHHTHFELSTCLVCSVKHDNASVLPPNLVRSLPIACAWSRSPIFCLVRWSVICYQDGCLMAFAKGALPEEYLSHNFDEHTWEDTRLI